MNYLIFSNINENEDINNIINDIILRYNLKQEIKKDFFKQIGKYSFILLNSELNNLIISLEKDDLRSTNFINLISLLKTSNLNEIIDYINIDDKFELNFDIYKYNLNFIDQIIKNSDNKELMLSLKNKTIKSSDDIINEYKILCNNIQKNNKIKDILYFYTHDDELDDDEIDDNNDNDNYIYYNNYFTIKQYIIKQIIKSLNLDMKKTILDNYKNKIDNLTFFSINNIKSFFVV